MANAEKAAVATSKGKLTRIVNSIKTEAKSPTPRLEYCEMQLKRADDALTNLEVAYRELLVAIDSTDMASFDAYCEIVDEAVATVSELRAGKKLIKEDSGTNSGVQSKCRIPDMSPFSNKIRDYMQFKSRFKKYYESYYGDYSALVLKENLLQGSSKSLCASCDTCDDVFKRLDTIFGDEGKLCDTVMEDIERLPNANRLEDLKQIRDSVNTAIGDLSNVGLEKHVMQYQTVSTIVRKLTPTVQRRWAERIAENLIPADKRFHELLKFIDVEIRTQELLPQPTPTPLSTINAPSLPVSASINVQQYAASPWPKSPTLTVQPDSQMSSGDQATRNKCPLHLDSPSFHFFSRCEKFRRMSPTEKADTLKNAAKSFCRSCLRPGHSSKDCTFDIKCNKDNCNKRHFAFVHEACAILSSTDDQLHAYHSAAVTPIDSISPSQTVRVDCESKAGSLCALWDTGSNITLVMRATCDNYAFEKIDENDSEMEIAVAGGTTSTMQVCRYVVPLLTSAKEPIAITAYAVDSIGSLPRVDVSKACDLFGVPETDRDKMSPPAGPIHLLIGSDNAQLNLLPSAMIDGLVLSETIFGRVIWGRHPSFVSTSHCNTVIVKTRLVSPTSFMDTKSKRADEIMDQNVRSLFSTDVMGVACPSSQNWTPQERFEHDQIISSISIQDNVITASYPYRRDIATLPNNYELALKRLEQTERKLCKDPELSSQYQSQIDDMIERGKLRLLSLEEMSSWCGPIQYLPHNYILKPGSSTPCRLVFDPSSSYRGHAVNDYWGRGPNLVNDLFPVLLRFREFPTPFFGDIKKMYQTVQTTPKEWHLHRMLWRNMETRSPDTYIVTCNSFGSGPAGTVAIAALRHIAELMHENHPRAASTICEQSYVDDILDSVETPEEARQLTEDIDNVLSKGSFEIKKWTIGSLASEIAYPATAAAAEPESIAGTDSVLGLRYCIESDEFRFTARINFSKKKRGVHSGPDLSLSSNAIQDRTVVPTLTKRMVVSQVHSVYDPIGFLAPFLVELKFALGKLWRHRSATGEQLDWDDEIPSEHDELWRKLLTLFYELESCRFPRCLSVTDRTGKPILIVQSDSSMLAFGACAHIRWERIDGSVVSRLVSAKTRMWPIDPEDYLSVCRGELQAAVLASRLAKSIVDSSRFDFAEVIFVIDSEIVMAQLRMDSHNFTVFVGNRVAEIRASTDPSQWYFTRSENNYCADLLSRGTINLSLLARDSAWQVGPPWLSTSRDQWPISQKTSNRLPVPELRVQDITTRTMSILASAPDLPIATLEESSTYDVESKICYAVQTLGEHPAAIDALIAQSPDLRPFTAAENDDIAQRFDLTRQDSLQLWLAVTYRVLHVLSWKTGDSNLFLRFFEPHVVSAEQRHAAKQFWIKNAQRMLQPSLKSGKLKTLTPFTDADGVIRCNARAGSTPGAYQPILLPNNHPFSRLLVLSFHRRGHGGSTATAARVRAEYHILKLRSIAKSVRNNCYLCKLVEKKLMQAPMGSLPVARLLPSYPFEHSSCDLFGPFHVKLLGRTTRATKKDHCYNKAYGLLITCLSTRAIHLEVMHGQDTPAFLLAFRRFVCMRGQPRSMFSDCGGQLVKGDSEIQDMTKSFDQDKLKQYGAENGMTWHYSAPGSPWQNGVSESLVKSVKQTMKIVINPDTQLPIIELQTVFYEVAQILNERPIGLGKQGASGDDMDVSDAILCPNQLLLGRSTPTVPQGPFEYTQITDENRHLAVQTLVTDWWRKWTAYYLPSLVHQSKWYSYSRSAEVGDIVYCKDLNPIRAQWNIAEIVKTSIDDRGVPINVLTRYRPLNSKTSKFQWRDVKNLCLVVPVEKRSNLNPLAKCFRPSTSD